MINELVIEAAKRVYDQRYEKMPYEGIAVIELFNEALLFSFVYNEQRYVMNVIRDQVILTTKGKAKIESLLLMPVNELLYESFLNNEWTVLELFKAAEVASIIRIGWINGRIYPLIPVKDFTDIQDMITAPSLYYSGKMKLQLADDTIENRLIIALQNWQISANKILQQYAYKSIPLEAFPSSLGSIILNHKSYDEPLMTYFKTVIQKKKLEVDADLRHTANNLIALFDLSTELLKYILEKRGW
ncbi:hypothetical protein ABD91_21560 [Lysinibacillus sphaericus]|uniref:hypothetical protein n=1 Tax=Lysinibacillus sphaericus TaxID=1421 RepID=UPI0018CE393B|nr:hypothetical protein [Lysinibacillus sphaericus]MBG9693325.1 hypothetical protein [Lysinibacillus sphaericus]